jgi:hypothetical protein
MTLYERKITRNPSGLDENEKIQSAYESILNEAEYDLTFLDSSGKIIYSGSKSGVGGVRAKNTSDAIKKAKENMKDFPNAKKVRLAIIKRNIASKIGDFNLNESLNEASSMTVDEFVKKLEATIKKIFPKSYIQIYASKNLGASITFRFALGKDKSEWVNGIIQNDPLFHTWMIGWNSFTEGHFIKDKIEADMSVGGTLKIKPEEGSYMAFGRVKIGWRKKTDTPDKIIKHFDNYFKKVKQTLKSNKDNLPDEDKRLNKNKL